MKGALTLESPAEPRVRLRSAGPGDLERLRSWKNGAKESFFHKGDINELMQRAWFAGYLERADDFMFIVECEGRDAGCLGFRLHDDAADIYNVIAAPEKRGQGVMTAALRLLCSHIGARHTKSIGCAVIKGNPALRFYECCGFRLSADRGDHDRLAFDWNAFRPVDIR